MAVLVTGGAGYIGSHTLVELLNEDYDVIVLDNFSNSVPESLNRVKQITGKYFFVYEVDLLDVESLRKVFKENKIDSVIHFAALKAVGESVELPMKYYENNISGTINLCKVMQEFNVTKFVFSSSATVYGVTDKMPLTEDSPTGATNPYGWTKLMMEQILTDIANANNNWSVAILRYFNPVGAHESGIIGESPSGIPNNLMPFVTQVAVGKRDLLSVWGNDYPTHDGTGVRDYIHVVDLAKGHVKALEKISTSTGVQTYNLGTGKGYSVLDLVKAFEKASWIEIPYKIMPRRSGDIATCYADTTKAKNELGWVAEKGMEEMCSDSWKWQKNNPNGFVAQRELVHI